jgi:NAD+ kinase
MNTDTFNNNNTNDDDSIVDTTYNNHENQSVQQQPSTSLSQQLLQQSSLQQQQQQQQRMELIWCDATSICMSGEEYLREMVLHHHHENYYHSDKPIQQQHNSNHIVYRGPATGQVAYHWIREQYDDDLENDKGTSTTTLPSTMVEPKLPKPQKQHCILFLIKQGSDMISLIQNIVVPTIVQLIQQYNDKNVHILFDDDTYPIIRQQIIATYTATTTSHNETSSLYNNGTANTIHDTSSTANTDANNHTNTTTTTTTTTTTIIDIESLDEMIHLLDHRITSCRGFGENISALDIAETEFGIFTSSSSFSSSSDQSVNSYSNNKINNMGHTSNVHTDLPLPPPILYIPNLIVTVGGDGLLMHAGMLFQGPMPPILCIAGGSLGFLTPFAPNEMLSAIEIALGLSSIDNTDNDTSSNALSTSETIKSKQQLQQQELKKKIIDPLQIFPPNMGGYDYQNDEDHNDHERNGHNTNNNNKFTVGLGDCICLSIRMRLDCRIIDSYGVVKARYNVLNEVVIDRGSSPYLAALECFCDGVHLTTVQADGVIFATPTGSTAYSLAAGSSVVHPAVPCILVTPICPHVLSFRSMVFPDHVILRCYVPHDARAVASVAFDGKHRQELHRGDSVQIRMSAYPVPTINRQDHSADWLHSLKRNFNFNSRPRQRPL